MKIERKMEGKKGELRESKRRKEMMIGCEMEEGEEKV